MSWMRDTKAAAAPKARTEGLLIEQVDDETVVYDLDVKQVHCLGPLAAAVFDQCDGETSSADIARVASERVGWPVSSDDITTALAQLEECNLLSRPGLKVHNGLSRREMVRKSAMVGGVAVAGSLITSIAAPHAMAATNGIPVGCTGCGSNQDCVNPNSANAAGHCCQTTAGKQCNQSCCVKSNNSCRLVDPNCTALTCACTVDLAGCGAVVCPPSSTKCCT